MPRLEHCTSQPEPTPLLGHHHRVDAQCSAGWIVHAHALFGEGVAAGQRAANKTFQRVALTHTPKVVASHLGSQLQILEGCRLVCRVRHSFYSKRGLDT